MKSIRLCTTVSIAAVCVILAAQSAAQTFKTLYSFTGGTNGALPYTELVRDAKGNLYGTTSGGGNADENICSFGCGTVFELSKSGEETVLYSFCAQAGCTDGAVPAGTLVRDDEGNRYGATYYGGALGYGAIFKLSMAGTETVLYSFTGLSDGSSPNGVIRDDQGNLYGTTGYGAAGGCGGDLGCGTVFKLSKTGKETTLYGFTGGTDGGNPPAGVIRDAQGTLYGTAASGGDLSCGIGSSGCGVVFKLSGTGKETVLHRFKGGTDGADPYAGVIRDDDGNLYGTTEQGGTSERGTVFEVSKTGRETVLYRFKGGADGLSPFAGLFRDAKGNLYGSTVVGGDLSCAPSEGHGCGVVFKLSKAGEETVLHTFKGEKDGQRPNGVIQDSDGNLYGTAVWAGDTSCDDGLGCGVVFKLTP